MDFNRVKLILNTVKYLKFEQVAYRVLYSLRSQFVTKEYSKQLKDSYEPIIWNNTIVKATCYESNLTFNFLNISHVFSDGIDWNLYEYGKLWTYNLNYFDFLNQSRIDKTEALELIFEFIDRDAEIKVGHEPYPTSLRLINWVKFLSKEKIEDSKINESVYNQYLRLLDNLEYHILGNHLLENAFSLLFGAYYLQDNHFYQKAYKIITEELNEQVLDDGGHFELSPMYHCIVLDRLLDCVQLVQKNSWKTDDDLLSFMLDKASEMLCWLNVVTFKNGHVPMVNDTAFSIAPTTKSINEYASCLGIQWIHKNLSRSGYRKFENDRYELFMDVGAVGPSYQPGHAHADSLSFVLYANRQPLIVDTGLSTYNIGEKRERERATESHNTVTINDENSSQVWAGFRVARRAKVTQLVEAENCIQATHDGYAKQGYLHTREYCYEKSQIQIKDSISKKTNNKAKAHFHFHSSVSEPIIRENNVYLTNEKVTLSFKDSHHITLTEYDLSEGFNKVVKAYKIIVTFDRILESTISL